MLLLSAPLPHAAAFDLPMLTNKVGDGLQNRPCVTFKIIAAARRRWMRPIGIIRVCQFSKDVELSLVNRSISATNRPGVLVTVEMFEFFLFYMGLAVKTIHDLVFVS